MRTRRRKQKRGENLLWRKIASPLPYGVPHVGPLFAKGRADAVQDAPADGSVDSGKGATCPGCFTWILAKAEVKPSFSKNARTVTFNGEETSLTGIIIQHVLQYGFAQPACYIPRAGPDRVILGRQRSEQVAHLLAMPPPSPPRGLAEAAVAGATRRVVSVFSTAARGVRKVAQETDAEEARTSASDTIRHSYRSSRRYPIHNHKIPPTRPQTFFQKCGNKIIFIFKRTRAPQHVKVRRYTSTIPQTNISVFKKILRRIRAHYTRAETLLSW